MYCSNYFKHGHTVDFCRAGVLNGFAGTQRFGAGQNMATRGMSNSRTRNGNERPKSTSRNNQNKNGNERPRSTSRSNQNRNVQRNPQNVKGVQQQNKGPLQAERGLEANQDTNKELHQREQQDLKEKEKEETAAKKGCLYEDPLDVSDAPVFTANRSPMNLGNIEGDWEVVKGKEKGNMSGVKQGGRENGKKGLGVFEERNRYGVLGERKENLDPGEGLKSGRESEGVSEEEEEGKLERGRELDAERERENKAKNLSPRKTRGQASKA